MLYYVVLTFQVNYASFDHSVCVTASSSLHSKTKWAAYRDNRAYMTNSILAKIIRGLNTIGVLSSVVFNADYEGPQDCTCVCASQAQAP